MYVCLGIYMNAYVYVWKNEFSLNFAVHKAIFLIVYQKYIHLHVPSFIYIYVRM